LSQPRIVFAGTPAFAVASLAALVDAGRRPVAVMTQPDRPAGRGKRLSESPVKRYAAEQGLPVLQPASLREATAVEELAALRPDLLIVAAYGLLLPQDVLDVPAIGCVNVHASLLPRWRGAAPIQAAILAGDRETGVCLMAMTAGLDCGPVYTARSTPIGSRETAGELQDRLAAIGGALLVRELPAILAGNAVAAPQDETRATAAPKIRTADAELDWRRPAADLLRAVRAYNPAPGAWFMLGDERVKCWSARGVDGVDEAAGTVAAAGAAGIVVACGEGAVALESLQRPGRRPVTAAEFASGQDLAGRRL